MAGPQSKPSRSHSLIRQMQFAPNEEMGNLQTQFPILLRGGGGEILDESVCARALGLPLPLYRARFWVNAFDNSLRSDSSPDDAMSGQSNARRICIQATRVDVFWVRSCYGTKHSSKRK